MNWFTGSQRRTVSITLLFMVLAACGAQAVTRPTAGPPTVAPAGGSAMIVYTSPTCSCCQNWNTHVADHGFQLTVNEVEDIAAVKDRYGVPHELRSCHTAIVDGYLIEGHVPAADIERLLRERPAIAGLAVPGMPIGSPGMEVDGMAAEPFAVLSFDTAGKTTVFAQH